MLNRLAREINKFGRKIRVRKLGKREKNVKDQGK